MTYKVIDTKTGKEPTDRVISNIARKGGLMEMDIDGFYVDEDGQIILVDDCGRCTWIDGKRFKAIPAAEPYKGMTNGAVICLVYPNLRYVIQDDRVITTIGVASSFDLDWWNAPYREDG